jgi:hypothetical protein
LLEGNFRWFATVKYHPNERIMMKITFLSVLLGALGAAQAENEGKSKKEHTQNIPIPNNVRAL